MCPLKTQVACGTICPTFYDRFDCTKYIAGVTHTEGKCPLKLRLRALLQKTWQGTDFRSCLLKLMSSEYNFYQTICEAGAIASIITHDIASASQKPGVRKAPLPSGDDVTIANNQVKKSKYFSESSVSIIK